MIMKLGLFILSALGVISTAYFLAVEVAREYSPDRLIYILLLAVLLCNCAVGLIMAYPNSFSAKRKLRYSK